MIFGCLRWFWFGYLVCLDCLLVNVIWLGLFGSIALMVGLIVVTDIGMLGLLVVHGLVDTLGVSLLVGCGGWVVVAAFGFAVFVCFVWLLFAVNLTFWLCLLWFLHVRFWLPLFDLFVWTGLYLMSGFAFMVCFYLELVFRFGLFILVDFVLVLTFVIR